MSGCRMFRWECPIDDRPHQIPCGSLQHNIHAEVGPTPRIDFVEFWTPDTTEEVQVFQVFGTGQPVPEGWRHVATAPRFHGLVFHLFVRESA